MIAALIRSTEDLSRLSFGFIPPSIMALWARTDVKRSSSVSTGISGKCFLRDFMKASTSLAASGTVRVHGIAYDKKYDIFFFRITFKIIYYLCRMYCIQCGRENPERVADSDADPFSAVIYTYHPVHIGYKGKIFLYAKQSK